MIVITKVDYFEVGEDQYRHAIYRHHLDPFIPCISSSSGDKYVTVEDVQREIIRGRRYVRTYDGTDLVIGCSQEVQKILGLQLDAWDRIVQESKDVERENRGLKEWCRYVQNLIKGAGFFTRLWWVFFGMKIKPYPGK